MIIFCGKICKRLRKQVVFITLFVPILLTMNSITVNETVYAKDFDEAVQYFHKNYHTEININEYAAAHHMSVSWFIRGFKEYTDSTPTQYILSLRISNAQYMLWNKSCRF